MTHEIGRYRPAALLLDRGVLQPEAVAYGSACHPERGGAGLTVPVFPSARHTQTITVHESVSGPTRRYSTR